VEEFHGQFKIGGGKKKEMLLDWRGNEKKKKKKLAHDLRNPHVQIG
jgi:hypothetical protein